MAFPEPRKAILLPTQTELLVDKAVTCGKESILMTIEAVSLHPLLSVPVTKYLWVELGINETPFEGLLKPVGAVGLYDQI